MAAAPATGYLIGMRSPHRLVSAVFIALGAAASAATSAAATTQPTTAVATRPTTLPAAYAAAAADLAREIGPRLRQSRYMEAGEGRDVVVRGWEGFPTRRYTYSVKDMDGTTKSAGVILLDPEPRQIARWIVSAVVEVTGGYDAARGRDIFRHIIAQSGGQFPVAGVVYEDILPADGKNEIYCFRDGVTVAVENVPHRGTAPLTPQQVTASIGGKVTRVYTYARIASTSPQMWIAAGGAKDVLGADGKPTEKWLAAVRDAYQAAWTSDRNTLLVAWVKANVK
jgi:hypothetical protein